MTAERAALVAAQKKLQRRIAFRRERMAQDQADIDKLVDEAMDIGYALLALDDDTDEDA